MNAIEREAWTRLLLAYTDAIFAYSRARDHQDNARAKKLLVKANNAAKRLERFVNQLCKVHTPPSHEHTSP